MTSSSKREAPAQKRSGESTPRAARGAGSPLPVVVCDDSALARKQMARALPAGWNVALTFAANGAEALEAVRARKGDVLFMDLNMPVMDGFEALAEIRRCDLPTFVIVVSGDIQPEARQRVLKLGAMDFIKKPVDTAAIAEVLARFGIYTEGGAGREVDMEASASDCYQEMANVAMGRAADLLARLLQVYVGTTIPTYRTIEAAEIHNMLSAIPERRGVHVVCQGFRAPGIAGEALLFYGESRRAGLAALLRRADDGSTEQELLLDGANILIGACLKAVAEQLDVNFGQAHPELLSGAGAVGGRRPGPAGGRALTIEMGYTVEARGFSARLLLLFTEDSVKRLDQCLAYLGGGP